MVDLLGKIQLRQDESIPGDFHSMHVTVEVELQSGATHSTICRAPRGSWGVQMVPGEHEAKLTDCLKHAGLEGAASEKLLTLLDTLDTLDAAGVESLLALMVSRAVAAA